MNPQQPHGGVTGEISITANSSLRGRGVEVIGNGFFESAGVTRGINLCCKLMAVPLVLKDYRACLCVTSLWSSQAAHGKHSRLILLFYLCA